MKMSPIELKNSKPSSKILPNIKLSLKQLPKTFIMLPTLAKFCQSWSHWRRSKARPNSWIVTVVYRIITNSWIVTVVYRIITNFTQERGFKRFLSFKIGKAGDELSPGALRNPLQVNLLAPSDGHGSRLNEILEAEVINTTGRQDDVGSGAEDLLDALFRDVGLAVTDFLQLLGVGDENLHI